MANSCANEWASIASITKLLFIVEYEITLPSMTFSGSDGNHETNIQIDGERENERWQANE